MLITIHVGLDPSRGQQQVVTTWQDLKDVLRASAERQEKGGAGWSPAAFSGPRLKANAVSVSAFVADLDDVTPEQFDSLLEQLVLFDYSHAIHSTFTKGRYRLVIPLTNAVSADDWHRWAWRACVDKIGLPVDESCKDASRFYYLPQHAEGDTPEFFEGGGYPLDIGATPVAEKKPTPPPEHVDVAAMLADQAPVFDMEALREATKRLDADKREALAPILEHTALAQPGDRDNTLNRAMKLASWHWPVMTVEQMVELIRPSIEAMETRPEGLEHWLDIAASQYERGLKFRFTEEKKRNELAATANEIFGRPSVVQNFSAGDSGGASASAPGAGDMSWLDQLDWKVSKNGSRESVNKTGRNIYLILTNDTETKGLIRWHDFRQTIVISGGTFANTPTPSLETVIGNWLEKKYKYSAPKAEIYGQLLAVALDNKWNPLQEYLHALQWDGLPRAEKFLSAYAQCEGNHTHLSRIGRKFLISAVARALQPGCKVDTVLILQGRQGAKKSTFFEVLAGGADFFSDQQIDMHDKDAQMLISSKWIVEMSELTSFKRSDVESIKSFISKREDRFRAPYMRSLETHPRRCVFVGSSNSAEFLNDETGNRRFWPVTVQNLNIELLRQDRDQLLAEAVAAFKAGEPWWLEGEEAVIAEEEASLFRARSAFFESIYQWYMDITPGKRPAEVTTTFVAVTVLGASRNNINAYLLREIASVLLEMGCTMTRKRSGVGGRHNTYVFPEALRENLNKGVAAPVMTVIQEADGLEADEQ